MKVTVSRTQIFRLVCPRCNAKQWEYCEDSQGFYNFEQGVLSAFHVARIKKAEYRAVILRAKKYLELAK